MQHLLILAIGALAGFGYGYQTRPSFLGVQIPLDIVRSTDPMDASFRSELISTLAVSTAIGFGIALAIVLLLGAIGNSSSRKS